MPSAIESYLSSLPDDRQAPVRRLHTLFLDRLPSGFEAQMAYGMIGYVVPHAVYPAGYHCKPEQPLPFMGLASQKQAISVYHMGLYADPALLAWFHGAHAAASPRKLDMGKSCIRYKKAEHIPYELLGELAERMTPQDWIACYERQLRR